MNMKIIYYVYLLHKAINPLGRGKESKFNTNVDDVYLNFHRKRLVLTLLEELSQADATAEQEARRSIEVRTELGESRDSTVLCEVELKQTGELLRDLRLGC